MHSSKSELASPSCYRHASTCSCAALTVFCQLSRLHLSLARSYLSYCACSHSVVGTGRVTALQPASPGLLMHLSNLSLFGICRAGSPRVNMSFSAAGCCGAAGCAGALLAAPEGSGGLALGSGAALLAEGLLGEGAAFDAAWAGAGSLPDAAAAELQCREISQESVILPMVHCSVQFPCISGQCELPWPGVALNTSLPCFMSLMMI